MWILSSRYDLCMNFQLEADQNILSSSRFKGMSNDFWRVHIESIKPLLVCESLDELIYCGISWILIETEYVVSQKFRSLLFRHLNRRNIVVVVSNPARRTDLLSAILFFGFPVMMIMDCDDLILCH